MPDFTLPAKRRSLGKIIAGNSCTAIPIVGIDAPRTRAQIAQDSAPEIVGSFVTSRR